MNAPTAPFARIKPLLATIKCSMALYMDPGYVLEYTQEDKENTTAKSRGLVKARIAARPRASGHAVNSS